MAYQIDFTAQNHARRRTRKNLLRLVALGAVAGAAWGVYDAYTTYNEPTLNMRLAEYEAVVRPIEEMNAAWDEAAKEYDAMMRYYRLVWAANPTNFLFAMAERGAAGPGRGFHPMRWSLSTGGECRLDWLFVFNQGDKAEQAKALEGRVVNSVTSAVEVAEGKVAVSGVQLENLLRVHELNITAKFSLPDVKRFPAKERAMTDCVAEISAMRKKVFGAKIADAGDVKGAPATPEAAMRDYLALGRDKPDFPAYTNAIDVAGWMARADQFIAKHRIPSNDAERKRLKEAWNAVGDARFPWQRFRELDNAALAERTKALGSVSDGVKRFRSFLAKRHEDCKKKLEPFVEAYSRNDVFNEPLIESDLRDRAAKAAGIPRARAAFRDEPDAAPALFETADDKYSFTWVRWTLFLGDAFGREGGRDKPDADAVANPLTLEKVADCAKRVLELGPGYAIDTVKVDFGADGVVVGALIDGLLPVKKVEAKEKKTEASRDDGR